MFFLLVFRSTSTRGSIVVGIHVPTTKAARRGTIYWGPFCQRWLAQFAESASVIFVPLWCRFAALWHAKRQYRYRTIAAPAPLPVGNAPKPKCQFSFFFEPH